jgi:hypothetical protein
LLPSLAAAQQANFLAAGKIECVLERLTQCKAPGVECESREPSARDKGETLVIDFTSKKAFNRRDDQERPFRDVVEDKVEGDVRKIALARGGGERDFAFQLVKDGKMTGTRGRSRWTLELRCTLATR